MGITRACGLVGISRSLFAYESKRTGDVALTERMKEMAALKRRYGYRRIHILLRGGGWQTNHKRVWRLYSQAGLSVRKRRRKRVAPAERVVHPVAMGHTIDSRSRPPQANQWQFGTDVWAGNSVANQWQYLRFTTDFESSPERKK